LLFIEHLSKRKMKTSNDRLTVAGNINPKMNVTQVTSNKIDGK
jgi:hypothetical protein